MGNVRSQALLNLLKISSYFESQEDYAGVRFLLKRVADETFAVKMAKLDKLKAVFQDVIYQLDPINKKVVSEFGLTAMAAVRDFEAFHAFLPVGGEEAKEHDVNREEKWKESSARISEAYKQVQQIWEELSPEAQRGINKIYEEAERAMSTEWTPRLHPDEPEVTFDCNSILPPR